MRRRGWRAAGLAGAIGIVSVLVIAALLQFLAPDLAYQLRDRAGEMASGNRHRTFRIALGATTGSSYRMGTVLNRYLQEKSGYQLELLATAAPGNVTALIDRNDRIDFAAINSADDDAAKVSGVVALAALEPQYFMVLVPNASPVQEFRDLAGAVNPGARQPGQPATLGERVLAYYGLTAAFPRGPAPRVSIVRPKGGMATDFAAGLMTAVTRTQTLHSDLIEGLVKSGEYRLVPIRDHDALARSIDGTRPGFIPSGLYGPDRRIPAEPVPTITTTQLLVSRADVPGRVVRDLLEVIYDPRFARDLHYDLSEESGRAVARLALHPAADIYYHRNDLPTSDRLGRVSFVASSLAAIAAALQFVIRYRRNDHVNGRRRLLQSELAKLDAIRQRVETSSDSRETHALMREAHDLLSHAERDAAAGVLDADGIASLRSLHHVCWLSTTQRSPAPELSQSAPVLPVASSAPAPPESAAPGRLDPQVDDREAGALQVDVRRPTGRAGTSTP
jgi:TRAP-type uncharacterized transport system substrate-binding protein